MKKKTLVLFIFFVVGCASNPKVWANTNGELAADIIIDKAKKECLYDEKTDKISALSNALNTKVPISNTATVGNINKMKQLSDEISTCMNTQDLFLNEIE